MSEKKSTSSDDPLDGLLRAWAEARQASPSELGELGAKISAAIANEKFLDLGEPAPRLRRRTAAQAVAWFTAGVAASLLLLVCFFRFAGPRAEPTTQRDRVAPDEAPAVALLDAHDLAGKSVLFDAIGKQFDGGLAWLAEGDQDIHLEVGSPEKVSGGAALAMRLVMVRRSSGQRQWQRVWSTDVVTRSEQVIDGALPGTSAATVWAYLLPDGLISVDCDLMLSALPLAHVQFSGLLQSGVPRQVLSFTTTEAEYRLYETVARLPKEAA